MGTAIRVTIIEYELKKIIQTASEKKMCKYSPNIFEFRNKRLPVHLERWCRGEEDKGQSSHIREIHSYLKAEHKLNINKGSNFSKSAAMSDDDLFITAQTKLRATLTDAFKDISALKTLNSSLKSEN